MIVSKKWLQKYFQNELPDTGAVSDAFTFHAFEIEGVDEKEGDTIFDVKVLPNRAADSLSHRGVARELAAILNVPTIPDVLRAEPPAFPKTDTLTIEVEDARVCARYMGAIIRGVSVGPSPVWLREALESVGQRSINNIVDATNYVMLDLGQPLHAFDAALLTQKEGKYAIAIRGAVEGEKIVILSGEELELPAKALVVTDANANEAIGIAGIKGGKAAQITSETKDIILESANFDGTMVRVASQHLKLWTDAGKRFQNKLSPELAAYGMESVINLILEIAGGELEGVTDIYPAPQETTQVPVSLSQINALLGTEYSGNQVIDVFTRLGLAYKKAGEDFTVDPPFERRDITIAEDLIEEVGSIEGYDKVPSVELPPFETSPEQARYRGIERVKDFLAFLGFTELSTQSFAKEGVVYLANPLQLDRPALRDTLTENMQDALTRAMHDAPRALGPVDAVRLFEIGSVFTHENEHLALSLGVYPLAKSKLDLVTPVVALLEKLLGTQVHSQKDGVAEFDLSTVDFDTLGAEYEVPAVSIDTFTSYSTYPFITRDIALWAPSTTEVADVESLIRENAGELLSRIDLFDRFEKENRTSYAFRLVFESMDRTLTDEEINPIMEKITQKLVSKEYTVR
jgi:phenylalanyl-tRNA synthetase beta chain